MNSVTTMANHRRIAIAFGLVVGALIAHDPSTARADETPAACSLTTIDPYSGVVIKSCYPNNGNMLNPIDVAIDVGIETMYVVRGYNSSEPDEQVLMAFDISDVEAPVLVETLITNISDTSGAVAAVGVTAGNGMVFTANSCEDQFGCDGEVKIQGWNGCDEWTFEELEDGNLDPELTNEGMHSVFYDVAQDILYGAANRPFTNDFIPYWEIPSCPMDTTPGASAGVGDGINVQVHEVAVGYDRLAAAAGYELHLYESSSPYDYLAKSTDSIAYHSAVPFAQDKLLATEEMVGGRLLAYRYSGSNTLVPKGSHKIPASKTCSYHEIAWADGQMYASAFQAGMRAWRWVPDEGDLVLGAYFDTSNADGDDCSGGPPDWPGASGIAVGPPDGSNRRIVAVSNLLSGISGDNRTFLLSVYDPDVSACTNMVCSERSARPSPHGGHLDVVVATGTDDGSTYAGYLVRYPGSSSGPGSPSTVSQTGLTQGHDYGYDMVVGDFNDDGHQDVAVGAPGQAISGDEAGVVYVYHRASNGSFSLGQTLDQSSLGTNADGERFGAALAAGDFDRDGDDDLAVGAPAATEGTDEAAGAVFLFRSVSGSLTGWTTLTNTSGHEGDRFGNALAVGNFDGVAPVDLAIGVPQAGTTSAATKSGFVAVYEGNNGTAPTLATRLTQTGLDTNDVEDRFGFALASGDFNDDGRYDLAVAAPGEHVDGISSGYVYVFLGSTTSTLVASHGLDQDGLDTNEEEDAFGRRLEVGDFDDDGYFDLAVAASGEMPGSNPRAGRVYVFEGTSTGLQAQTAVDQGSLGTHNDLDGFGERMAAGDWDADGKTDLLVVAPGLFHGVASNSLFMYEGTSSGPTSWQTL